MTVYLQRLERFFTTHTIWVFFTGILFVSISMIFQGYEQKWSVYLNFIFRISLIFSPVLLFVGFRNWLREKCPPVLFLVLWGFCFLAYPYLIEYLGTADFLSDRALGKVMIRMLGFIFLFSEIALQLNDFWLANRPGTQWLKRIHLEKAIFIFMIFFACLYIGFGLFVGAADLDKKSIFVIIAHVVQVFIIVFLYYIFYWVNHYFLITRIWKKKGIIYYIFGFAAVLLFYYPIAAQLIAWLPMVQVTDIHPVHNKQIFEDVNWWIPLLGMLFSIPFILAVRWFKQSQELAVLAKEKSEAELGFLKQQINPHFFFNTLNNLYALSLTKDKQTPEVILQLSELMRYVIYKGKENQVTLKEEVQYLEDYLKLQQIRLHKRLSLTFEKDISDDSRQIPPLLFIPLVENAFKHGIEPAENACFLKIHLKSDVENLVFVCENSFEERSSELTGIGLKNLKRRLALRFPNQHRLEIEEGEGVFKVRLEIETLRE